MTVRGAVWYRILDVGTGGVREVECRAGDAYPDGATVPSDRPLPTHVASAPLVFRTHRTPDSSLVRLEFGPTVAPEAPSLWFVSVPEPRATPRATNLVAFTGDRLPAGTVIDNYAFAGLRVSNDEQAAAVRWYPQTGIVHQVFVAPPWRRRQVGTALLYAAEAFHVSNGWPGHLRSDGRRTDVGEMFVAGLRHPQRIAPRTEDMPPMD